MVSTTHCSLKAMSFKTALIWRTVGRMYILRTVKDWGASDHPGASHWSSACHILSMTLPQPHSFFFFPLQLSPPLPKTTLKYLMLHICLFIYYLKLLAPQGQICFYWSLSVLSSKYLWNVRTNCIVFFWSGTDHFIIEVLILVIGTYVFWTNIFFEFLYK